MSKRENKIRSAEVMENEMIMLATDLAKKQLIEGTASSQVITHYLKLGSIRDQLEIKKLEKEIKLLESKAEYADSQRNMEELYDEALKAMRRYNGE